MELYVIRHCQSENNALWARSGSSEGRSPDPALTEVGHKQARYLADFLADGAGPNGAKEALSPQARGQNRCGYDLTHLYCSLMVRSVVTGTYIAETLDLPLVAWETIHERGGIYEHGADEEERIGLPGPNRTYFASNHPALVLPESLTEDGWWNRPYESVEQAEERARQFLRELLERHGDTDHRVGIVTHGGFFQSLLGVLFDFSPMTANLGEETPQSRWIAMHNASVSRIDFFEDAVALMYLNRVGFLPEELLT